MTERTNVRMSAEDFPWIVSNGSADKHCMADRCDLHEKNIWTEAG